LATHPYRVGVTVGLGLAVEDTLPQGESVEAREPVAAATLAVLAQPFAGTSVAPGVEARRVLGERGGRGRLPRRNRGLVTAGAAQDGVAAAVEEGGVARSTARTRRLEPIALGGGAVLLVLRRGHPGPPPPGAAQLAGDSAPRLSLLLSSAASRASLRDK
jgi:hypothetical protein